MWRCWWNNSSKIRPNNHFTPRLQHGCKRWDEFHFHTFRFISWCFISVGRKVGRQIVWSKKNSWGLKSSCWNNSKVSSIQFHVRVNWILTMRSNAHLYTEEHVEKLKEYTTMSAEDARSDAERVSSALVTYISIIVNFVTKRFQLRTRNTRLTVWNLTPVSTNAITIQIYKIIIFHHMLHVFCYQKSKQKINTRSAFLVCNY